mgnify:CR=1 FL=1
MAAKNEKRQFIKIRGANEHNLKNIDLDIPRNELSPHGHSFRG